jgi:hypothetical protein
VDTFRRAVLEQDSSNDAEKKHNANDNRFYKARNYGKRAESFEG